MLPLGNALGIIGLGLLVSLFYVARVHFSEDKKLNIDRSRVKLMMVCAFLVLPPALVTPPVLSEILQIISLLLFSVSFPAFVYTTYLPKTPEVLPQVIEEPQKPDVELLDKAIDDLLKKNKSGHK